MKFRCKIIFYNQIRGICGLTAALAQLEERRLWMPEFASSKPANCENFSACFRLLYYITYLSVWFVICSRKRLDEYVFDHNSCHLLKKYQRLREFVTNSPKNLKNLKSYYSDRIMSQLYSKSPNINIIEMYVLKGWQSNERSK